MKIKSIRIQNFRAFEDETISFSDYTCLVGPNGAGKSTILCGLNIFFRETAGASTNLLELEEEDFHSSNTAQPITITIAFSGLSPEAQKDFADYFRQGELVLSARATFDSTVRRATVIQYGQRRVMAEFAPFFEADKEKKSVDDLRQIYVQLRERRPDLSPPAAKAKMIEALRGYEEQHPELCELLPSEDELYGFTKGKNRLARWVQWVFVPAVKDAVSEQHEAKDTALGKLLARTVRSRISFGDEIKALRAETETRYETMLAQHQGELDEISASLKKRLIEWAHPDATLKLEWQRDPERSVRVDEPFAKLLAGEGAFTGNIARFGHGLQRAYLLALLQELAVSGNEGGPTLLLACEEPELYQHPPQCRHMAGVLQTLSTTDAQVIVSTHSPYFASGKAFEDIRMVRKDPSTSKATVARITIDELGRKLAEVRDNEPPKILEGNLLKIHQALQPALSEIFFTSRLVLVEGREDIAYITTYVALLGLSDEFRRVGCHFVPTDGKSKMLAPLAITLRLGVPTFIVFDSDGHLPDKSGSREMHRKDNLALLRLDAVENPDPYPTDHLWASNAVMWKSEMGLVVAEDFKAANWKHYKEMIEAKYGHVGGLDKNPLFIADLLETAWNDGQRSPTLERLCTELRRFCSI